LRARWGEDRGFYFGEDWKYIFLTELNGQESKYDKCDKCLSYTKVYDNETKWLCKPCEMAVQNKKRGYIDI